MPYALGAVAPHVRAAAEEVGAKFGIRTIYGVGLRPSGNSDHPRGLALDYMTGTDRAKGDALAAFMQANAGRLGVKYLIWRQRIWFPGREWRPMADRGSPTANHEDHIHASFNGQPGSGPAVEGISIGLPDPLADIKNQIGSLVGAAQKMSAILGWLANSRNWLRIGMVIGGAFLLAAALFSLGTVKETVNKAATAVGKVK